MSLFDLQTVAFGVFKSAMSIADTEKPLQYYEDSQL